MVVEDLFGRMGWARGYKGEDDLWVSERADLAACLGGPLDP